jgi:ParB/RepB/Spo0J family partition protein
MALADSTPIARSTTDLGIAEDGALLSGRFVYVPHDEVAVPGDPGHAGRRIRRDLGDTHELAMSLAEVGVLEPIVVYEEAGHYVLVAGERRLRAARRIEGATAMPAIVRTLPQDPEQRAIAKLALELTENENRKELTNEEEADAFIQLVRQRNVEMQDVAQMVGRSKSYVSKRVRVFEDVALRAAVLDGLNVSMAEEVLGLADDSARGELLDRAVKGNWGQVYVRVAAEVLSSGLARADELNWSNGQTKQASAKLLDAIDEAYNRGWNQDTTRRVAAAFQAMLEEESRRPAGLERPALRQAEVITLQTFEQGMASGWTDAQMATEVTTALATRPQPTPTTWPEGIAEASEDDEIEFRTETSTERLVPQLQNKIDRPKSLTKQIASLRSELALIRVRTQGQADSVCRLDGVIGEMRPWQFTQADQEELRGLFLEVRCDGETPSLQQQLRALAQAQDELQETLTRLGRAPAERKIFRPSIEAAEAAVVASRRSRGSARKLTLVDANARQPG